MSCNYVNVLDKNTGRINYKCNNKIKDYYLSHVFLFSGNWIFRVYILSSSGNDNDTLPTFMTKTEILRRYTTDGRKTPTAFARTLAPSGAVVVAISESYETPTTNWWLDDVVGNVVLALLCLAGFGVVSTELAVCVDFVWFSRRPT